MAVSKTETLLDVATRYVTEAEQRRARQIDLIAELTGQEQAQAEQVLTEIERTLAIARTHRSLLLSFADEP
jgi:ABC-type Fe3+-hydroxamate transport system substrate-binding protein